MLCVASTSTSLVPSSATQARLNLVQVGSLGLEYDPIHHTNLVYFLCHCFNHFWPMKVLCLFVSLNKAYFMVNMHITRSGGIPLYYAYLAYVSVTYARYHFNICIWCNWGADMLTSYTICYIKWYARSHDIIFRNSL